MKLVLNMVDILVFLLCSIDATGQYTWQHTTANFNDVKVIRENEFIIIGDDGRLNITRDNGKTWRWIETFIKCDFNSITGTEDGKMLIAADSGYILESSDEGENWVVEKPLFGDLQKIDVYGDTYYVITADKAEIFKSTNKGSKWEQVFSADSGKFMDLKIINDSVVFACGEGNLLVRTTDGGKTWKNYLEYNEKVKFRTIDFYNENLGYCAGINEHTYECFLYKITGKENEISNLYDTSNQILPLKIKFLNEKEIFSLGANGKYYLTDNNFNLISGNQLTANEFYLLKPNQYKYPSLLKLDFCGSYFVSVGNIFSIAVSQDSGKTFRLTNWMDLFKHPLNPIAIRLDGSVPLNYNEILVYGEGLILKSTNNGIFWHHNFPKDTNDSNLNDGYLTSHHFKNSNDGFVSGYLRNGFNQSLTFFTTDGGFSWAAKQNVKTFDLGFIDNNQGISVCDSIISRTTDCGENWDTVFKAGKNELFQRAECFGAGDCFALTFALEKTTDSITFPSRQKYVSRLYHSTDLFDSYEKVFEYDNKGTEYKRIKFMNEKEGYIFGSGNVLIKTTNGGSTWSNILLGDYHYVTDLYFITDSIWLMSGYRDSLYITEDRGANWKTIINNFSFDTVYAKYMHSNNISMLPDSSLLIVGTGKIIRGIKTEKLITGAEEINDGSFNRYFYIKVSPMPAKNFVDFTLYGLYSVKNALTVKAFDIFGNEVADFSSIANKSSDGSISCFKADVSNFARGVYFIQMASEGYVKMEKFLVIN